MCAPVLPEAFDPLGQRLRTSAERRVNGRLVSAPRLVAGYDAFAEVDAQARHSVGEPAHADADERALLCPDQLFVTALHGPRNPDVSLACASLVKDEVQGDQEGDLHGEDGHAGRDRDVAPFHGPPFPSPWGARRKFCAAAEGPAAGKADKRAR